MIADKVISLLMAIIGFVFSLLPTGDLHTVLTPVTTTISSIASYGLSAWDSWLPLTEAFQLLNITVSTILPAVIVYKLANWTWRHIPDLWGFGPGAG